MKDVDRLFEDEPTPPAPAPPPLPSSGFPEDPPELRARLVSAIGGECSDLSLLPARFEQFASKTEDALKTLAAGMKQITESVLPLLALQGKRIDEGHRETLALANRVDAETKHNDRQDARLDSLEQRVAKLEKVQRPKRARKR